MHRSFRICERQLTEKPSPTKVIGIVLSFDRVQYRSCNWSVHSVFTVVVDRSILVSMYLVFFLIMVLRHVTFYTESWRVLCICKPDLIENWCLLTPSFPSLFRVVSMERCVVHQVIIPSASHESLGQYTITRCPIPSRLNEFLRLLTWNISHSTPHICIAPGITSPDFFHILSAQKGVTRHSSQVLSLLLRFI